MTTATADVTITITVTITAIIVKVRIHLGNSMTGAKYRFWRLLIMNVAHTDLKSRASLLMLFIS